jgi:hypothetical protein
MERVHHWLRGLFGASRALYFFDVGQLRRRGNIRARLQNRPPVFAALNHRVDSAS